MRASGGGGILLEPLPGPEKSRGCGHRRDLAGAPRISLHLPVQMLEDYLAAGSLVLAIQEVEGFLGPWEIEAHASPLEECMYAKFAYPFKRFTCS